MEEGVDFPKKIELVDEKKTYTLTWGCHRGALMSRDIGEPYILKTESEALAKVEQLKKYMRRIGYYLWYANINGKNVYSTPYY